MCWTMPCISLVAPCKILQTARASACLHKSVRVLADFALAQAHPPLQQIMHPVLCPAGKFLWFLLYTYVTLIYFTFFGESRAIGC